MADYTERFSNKAEIYNTYRPKYPKEIGEILRNDIHLASDKLVADIGSGTGISSEIFLDNGNMVFAVEPNGNMREMAEQNFDLEENFVSVNGTAENTGLNDQSIDLIFAGTAFHWFDLEKTKQEFRRILKPGGTVMISWIARDMTDALQQETENIFNRYTTEIESVEKQKDGENITEFFGSNKISERKFTHSQSFDWEQFLGRLRSSSYFPGEDSEDFEPMVEDFRRIFDEFEVNGSVDFKYETVVYWSVFD